MIPSSRPKFSDLYTPSQSKLFEKKLETAAHTYIAHKWQYPPPPTQWGYMLKKTEETKATFTWHRSNFQ